MSQFEHGGKKIKLLLCQTKTEQDEQKHVAAKKIKGISLNNAKAFSQEVEKWAPFLILTTKKVIEEPSSLIPPKVTPVIMEFANVFSEDLTDKLSPLRDIQHAIDLIPWANLLNLPHYMINPTEHAELKRQVDELIKKGFI